VRPRLVNGWPELLDSRRPPLAGQRDHRGVDPGRRRDARGDPGVLRHQPEPEPAAVPAGQDLGAIVQLADERPAGRGVDDVDHRPRVEAEPLADRKRLGDDAGGRGGDHVVQRLHRVPGAQRPGAELPRGVAEHPQHRLDGGNVARRAADHDRQFPRHRPGDPARHGRVDNREAKRFQSARQLQRVGRIGGAHVQHDRAG
jgi:hypothetical protein